MTSASLVKELEGVCRSRRASFAIKMEGTPGYYAAALAWGAAVRNWIGAGGRLRLVKNG